MFSQTSILLRIVQIALRIRYHVGKKNCQVSFSTLMYSAERKTPDPEMAWKPRSSQRRFTAAFFQAVLKASHYSSVSTSMQLGSA